jgi:hypothetical protein
MYELPALQASMSADLLSARKVATETGHEMKGERLLQPLVGVPHLPETRQAFHSASLSVAGSIPVNL